MHQPFPLLISSSSSGRNFGHSWSSRAHIQQRQSGWLGTFCGAFCDPYQSLGMDLAFCGVTCLKTKSKNDCHLHTAREEAKPSLSGLETSSIWKSFCHTQRGLKNFFAGFPKKVESESPFYFHGKRVNPSLVPFAAPWAIHRNSAAGCDMSFLLRFLHRGMKLSSSNASGIYLRNQGRAPFSPNTSPPWDSPSDTLQTEISWFIISFLWQAKNVIVKLYSI